MNEPKNNARYRISDISDRQIAELIGLARGLLADGQLLDSEVDYLYKWLAATDAAVKNPLVDVIFSKLADVLSDNVIDDDERADLVSTLNQFIGEDFEVGEVLKPTTLPLTSPPPNIEFPGKAFCFTGTFTYGKRKDCEDAVQERGALVSGISGKTDFLVIGDYATDAWKQSSWGRKIEKAVALREKGSSISIVSESHWKKSL